MACLCNRCGNTCAFFAEQQHIIGVIFKLISRLFAFGGEQHQPLRTDAFLKCLKIGMTGDTYVVDIIHGRPADPAIIPIEPQWFDQIDSRSHARTKTQDGTDISGDFRFEQGNAHGC